MTEMRSGGGDGKTERQSEQLWKWGFERQMVCVWVRRERERERENLCFVWREWIWWIGKWHFVFMIFMFWICELFGSSDNRMMCVFSHFLFCCVLVSVLGFFTHWNSMESIYAIVFSFLCFLFHIFVDSFSIPSILSHTWIHASWFSSLISNTLSLSFSLTLSLSL